MENVIFPKSETVGERDWGSEDLLVLAPRKYSLKRLFIKKGFKGGLQHHRIKDEAGFVVSGKLIIRYDSGSGKLKERVLSEGCWFHFPPGIVHQEEAITDCVIVEVSTPHFNDRVRREEDYGISGGGGLPTTSIENIQTR